MKEERRLELLNNFANDLSIVKGANMEVFINPHTTHYQAKEAGMTMRAEDCELVSQTINGAKQFLWYLERNGYEITKK